MASIQPQTLVAVKKIYTIYLILYHGTQVSILIATTTATISLFFVSTDDRMAVSV